MKGYFSLIMSHEQSEFSYIGLGDFFVVFSGKVLFTLNFIFCSLTRDFFLSSVHFHR